MERKQNAKPADKNENKNDGKSHDTNELKHIGLDEARKQVQGAIRQWVSENAARTPQ